MLSFYGRTTNRERKAKLFSSNKIIDSLLLANEKVPKLRNKEENFFLIPHKSVFMSVALSEQGYHNVVSLIISKQIELDTWDWSQNVAFLH